ncbi:MAG: hypothetical protein JXA24_03340 [Proteobacteria bacterium]|nr:hypothetical protein [Pseudomonadota bacterium]
MQSGGMPMDAADVTSKVNDLGQQQAEVYDQLVDAQAENNALVEQANNETGPASKQSAEQYSEAYGDQQRVESDEATAEARTRNAEDAVRSAKENVEDFANQNQQSWKQLDPQRQQVRTAYDLANFYQWNYDRELRNKWSQFCLEAILESQNAGGAALVAFHAACMKMSAAHLGVSSNVSAQIYLNQYMRISELPDNRAIEQRASADAQAANLAAEERQIIDRAGDKYYENKLAEKRERLSEEKAKYDSEVAKLANAKAAAESLKAERDRLDEGHRALADKARAQERVVSELENNLRNLKVEEQRLVDEYNRAISEEERQRRAEAEARQS